MKTHHPYWLFFNKGNILFFNITLFLLAGSFSALAQVPTISSFVPTPICQGEAVTITGTNFKGATKVTLGTADAASFAVNSTFTSITAVVATNASSGTVTVTTPDGTATAVGTITILPAPIPILTDVSTMDKPFANCDGSLTYQLTVQNSSTANAGSSYDIDWGDQSTHFTQTDWAFNAQTSHLYNAQGYFNIILTITPTNGCKKTFTHSFYNGNRNGLAEFSTVNSSNSGLCAPAKVDFKIDDWYGNTPGTTYEIDFGDGSAHRVLTHPLNSTKTTQIEPYTYLTSSCPNPQFTATLLVTNGCVTKTYTQDQIVIGKKPIADFKIDPNPDCLNTPVCLTNNSSTGYSGSYCNSTTNYTWDFGDNTQSTDANPSCHTYTKAGTYSITLTATLKNTLANCPSDTKTQTVVVEPVSPTPTAKNVSYCQNQPAVPLTATGTGLLWYTTANGGQSYPSITPSTGTVGTVTYYVSQTLPNSCESPRVPVTVTVSASANASIVYAAICTSSQVAAVQITGSQGGTFTASPAGLVIDAATGAITPGSSKPGTYTVTYTIAPSPPCAGFTTTANVTVTQAPSASIAYSPASLCNATGNPPVTVTLTGSLGGSYTISPASGLPIDATTGTLTPAGATAGTYTVRYTVAGTGGCTNFTTTATVSVSGSPTASITYPAICGSDFNTKVVLTGAQGGTFASSPAGLSIDAATGTITPGTSTPGTYTVTYTIAPSPPCPGFTTKATVTVTKPASASIAYSPAGLCNAQGSPAVNVTLTGATGGIYTISPQAGLKIDPTAGTLTPSGATAGTYTVTYTVQGTGGCANITATANVTVSSSPTANVTYPAVCSSDAAANPVIVGSQGGTFTASPTGLVLDAATGTVTPGGSKPGTYTITYTIAPSSPCPGFTTTATVTLTQAPSAAIAYDPSSLCNAQGSPVVQVTQSGNSGGGYTINPATGLAIDAATGTLSPSNATPGAYMVTYTVQGTGGCKNVAATAKVNVSSAPTAKVSYPAVCGSDATAKPVVTGAQGGTFTASLVGLTIDAATGTISPGTSTPGTYTVSYTIAASPPCPGFTTTATVTVTKAPSAAIAYIPSSLCNVAGNPPVSVILTGSAGGVYSISPSTGLVIDATTGALAPANAKPGLYTVTYTVQGTGGCANITATANVTVSSAPTATIIFPAVCSSDITAKPVVTGVQGGTFTSAPAGLVIDAASGTITPGTSTPGTYTVTYTIAASLPCPSFTTTATVTVTKAPSAAIKYTPSSVCNATTNNPPVSVTLTGSAGGVYTISPAAGLPIDAATGTITPLGATAGTYTITYSVLGTGGCANITTTTNVTVSSAPIAFINYPGAPFCTGVNTLQQATVSGTLGGSFSATRGLSIDPTTGAINPSLSKPGTYTVTYTIQASAPCPGFVATTSVEIDESPVVTFTPSDQSACSGSTAVFTPSSTVTNTSYAWSVVGSLPSGVTGPMSGTVSGPGAVISVSYINSTQTSQVIKIQVLPTSASQNPCAGAPYTLTLHINPKPAALTGDTTQFCMHTPPAALTADPSPGNTVNWYDVNLALLPAAPVISTTVPATFTYYASQTNGFGCEGPKATFTAVVNPTAKIVSSSYRNPDSCGVPSGKIILSVVDLNDNPIPNINVTVHYTKFGTLYTILEKTDASGQIIVRLVAGTYSNIYVETFGCLSQPIPDVFVLKDPTPPARPTAGYNAPVCSETPLNLSASSPTSSQQGPVYYVWVGPAFGNVADTSQNTVVSFPSASTAYNGTYIVYAIQNNCISSDTSFQVVVQQSPSKPKILTRTPLCVGDNLTLQAFSSIPGNNTIQYSWAGPGTGFPVSGSYAAINDVTVSDGGIYSVTVSSPETGCSSTSDTLIPVGGYPVVKLPQNTLTLPTGYLLTLAPVITNENDPNVLPIRQYAWAPSQYLVCSDSACSSPTVTVTNDVCYTVKATNVFGCSGSDTVCVKVFCKNSQVFIPNAFTPRNGLAENAKFIVRSSGISSVKSLRIFNRWGKIVFERDNFSPNDPSYGWDGTVNGKAADTGVYIYTVEVVCDNGVPFVYNGNVTLL